MHLVVISLRERDLKCFKINDSRVESAILRDNLLLIKVTLLYHVVTTNREG